MPGNQPTLDLVCTAPAVLDVDGKPVFPPAPGAVTGRDADERSRPSPPGPDDENGIRETAGTGASTGTASAAEPARAVAATLGYLAPDELRPGRANARETMYLTRAVLAPLMADIRTAGRVTTPLLVGPPDARGVHPITDGVCRWQAVRWLVEDGWLPHDVRMPCLVEARAEADAYVTAEIANRSRRPVAVIERARAYQRALGHHASQADLARALGLRPASVSLALSLARWPDEVVGAYAHPHDILEVDVERLAGPLAAHRAAIVEAAIALGLRQDERRNRRERPIPRTRVTDELLAAAARGVRPQPLVIVAPDGTTVARVRSVSSRALVVELPGHQGRPADLLLAALAQLLRDVDAGRRGPVPLETTP